jgi:hypothetical protein
MIGSKSTVALLLYMLLMCLFSAQSASAAPSVNTTAFTCVFVGSGKGDFKDSHCDEKVSAEKGEYGHEQSPAFLTTQTAVINTTPGILKGEIAGVKVEVVCTKVANTGEATIHNIHNIFFGEHTVTGQIRLRLTSCTAPKPAKCTVKEPLDSEILEFRGREELGAGKNEMGMEFNGGGPAILFPITFENKGAEKCALGGKTFNVEGTAIATGAPAPTEKHSGATLNFTNAMTKETMKLGGKPAEFSTSLTMRGSPGAPPISLTTVT